MLKRVAAFAAASVAMLAIASPAYAGSPHFVGTPVATISGDSVTVTGKEAGLGNETQITVDVTVEAACVNGGGNQPQADNKETFAAGGDFPVQNGKANFSVTVPIVFDPDCAPPMSVQVIAIQVTDAANGLQVIL